MSEPSRFAIQVFDPNQNFATIERRLPHWSQAGTVSFITWRTWDSIPKKVLDLWLADRNDWLRRHGIDPKTDGSRVQLEALDPKLQRDLRRQISDRWNEQLDAVMANVCCGGTNYRK
jgi:putative transposase